MRRSVCPEGCSMFLTKSVVSGFPPHAGIPVLMQQLLVAVLSFAAAVAVCPTLLLSIARADGWGCWMAQGQ